MITLFRRAPPSRKRPALPPPAPRLPAPSAPILLQLDENLAAEALRLIQAAHDAQLAPSVLRHLTDGLVVLAEARARLEDLRSRSDPEPSELSRELEDMGKQVANCIDPMWRTPSSAPAQSVLYRAAGHFSDAAADLLPFLDGNRAIVAVNAVVVPTDLLFQLHQELLPAERMAIVSGRENGNGQVLAGAAFDVTGEAHTSHVQADPRKLAQALIAMERAGTHLALWIHSHPGTGRMATHPSATDTTQHADWIRDYTPSLVSVILVEDGWIRFWGSALERQEVALEVVGNGVTEEDSNVYRLA